MKYKLEKKDDIARVAALHTLIMPDDDKDLSGQLWVVHDELGTPVAFCSARECEERVVFLARAGVLPVANGNRLQRRMIHARLRWAQEEGAYCCITYCMFENHASIVNLLKCGFKFYVPEWKWAGDVHYFRKDIY